MKLLHHYGRLEVNMKTAVIFDTSIASNNMGDEIIVRSADVIVLKYLK